MDINKLLRYLAYVLEIMIMFALQQTPGIIPEIFGGRPVILIAVAITIAMFEQGVPAAVFGSICGMLIDFGSGGVLGVNALILTLLCFFISYLSHTALQVNLGTAIITGVWAVAIVVLLGWVIEFILPGYSHPVFVLTRRYLPKYLYTLLFTPLIFLLNKGLAGLIRAQD